MLWMQSDDVYDMSIYDDLFVNLICHNIFGRQKINTRLANTDNFLS